MNKKSVLLFSLFLSPIAQSSEWLDVVGELNSLLKKDGFYYQEASSSKNTNCRVYLSHPNSDYDALTGSVLNAKNISSVDFVGMKHQNWVVAVSCKADCYQNERGVMGGYYEMSFGNKEIAESFAGTLQKGVAACQ